jgi:hypothetical protein
MVRGESAAPRLELFVLMHFRLEVTSMTKLSPSPSHLPIGLHEISEEDRKTYKTWARVFCACYLLLIVGLLACGLLTRQSQMQTAAEGRADVHIVTKPGG